MDRIFFLLLVSDMHPLDNMHAKHKLLSGAPLDSAMIVLEKHFADYQVIPFE